MQDDKPRADIPLPSGEGQYLLVDSRVLPGAFSKVVRAKQLLAQGKAKSLTEATKAAGLSRSAFYKYKDCVFTYQNTSTRQIATLSAELVDEPGVLSEVLSVLFKSGANILTVNQNIPVDSVAPVSISMRTEGLRVDVQSMAGELRKLDGVVSLRILSN
ncbi:MAG: ACT domain-containing protein [Oscillospiraceae bacterium]|nr:ACT domain-containing protein [Oscillospiraceae bacterium]